ncbi:rhodanese-like domain-containing protein [Candidatus Ulvibacter alkanivorans]|uniref:rhodanese-like domain-containing protein n=1 Tax=Candidatus Ulvibacter alkanivorans TaxID=2267620 RepID=UPI000DF40325|nr:rhodanese-like domain-containing protein [Candidatus Ulvibacter alkanivorans]
MRSLHLLLVGLFFGIVLSCVETSATKVVVLSPEEMAEAVKQDELLQLLDVRTPEEYEVGHLKDSQNICVTSDDFEEKVKLLDKSKPVYVYCRKGGRSAKAADILKEMGFTEVYDLEGGLTAWKEEGLPTADE